MDPCVGFLVFVGGAQAVLALMSIAWHMQTVASELRKIREAMEKR